MKIAAISKPVLIAVVIALVFTGTYAYSGDIFSMYVALACAMIGVILRKFKVPSAAIVLGFVLGTIMEANLRRGLIITIGNYWDTFTNSTLSSVLLVLALVSIVSAIYPNYKDSQKKKTTPC
jgi:putative tricarboxylic transport membrane protein